MELGSFINKNLIGNEYFKKRLVEELKNSVYSTQLKSKKYSLVYFWS